MNSNDKIKLAEIIFARAKFYNKNIDSDIVSQMIDDLNDLDFEQIESVLSTWSKFESSFPYPALIRNKVKQSKQKKIYIDGKFMDYNEYIKLKSGEKNE